MYFLSKSLKSGFKQLQYCRYLLLNLIDSIVAGFHGGNLLCNKLMVSSVLLCFDYVSSVYYYKLIIVKKTE